MLSDARKIDPDVDAEPESRGGQHEVVVGWRTRAILQGVDDLLATLELFASPAQWRSWLASTVAERWFWGNALNPLDPLDPPEPLGAHP